MSAIRVAISGCGAVTQEYYIPTLEKRRDRLTVVGFHDPDPARSSIAAGRFPGSTAISTMDALLAHDPDLVIIASPPATHADQAIAALQHGIHVFCEKPMSLTLEDAVTMARTAEKHDRLLAIGMVRRHFPSSDIVTRLIAQNRFGALRSATIFEGGPFHWPVANQGYFTREVSGGGVLADIGTHVIDLLGSWFGGATLIDYEDDAMGGVEANARLTLRFGEARAAIRLSRDWDRPNLIDLRFERGSVQWRAEDLSAVTVFLNDEAGPLKISDEAATDTEFPDCFGWQLDAVADHLDGKPSRIIAGADVLPTVELIEQAYRQRRAMDMPWLAPVEVSAHG